MQLNTEHITYSFSVSATIAWLSILRRAAGPAPSSKKLSRITSRHTTVVKWGRRILRRAAGPAPSSKKLSRITLRHTTVVKWGRRILRRYCGTCPSSGWLFIKHAVRFLPMAKNFSLGNLNENKFSSYCSHLLSFFSATQWRIFIEIGRHAVRSGLSSWMRKTCFPATMTASMTTGCNPANNRFLFSFPAGVCALILKNNQIKKRDYLSYISMYGFQIMRASSPICSPSMQICFLPKQENHSIKNGRILPQ